MPYDTYIIEEMRCNSNKGFELIPPFEIVVSRNNLVIDLGTLTDEYEKEISIHTTATSKDGEKTKGSADAERSKEPADHREKP